MIKELLPSLKSHLDERMANPILGTFSLSWIIMNWKAFLFLAFSDKEIEQKISLIESSYSNWATVLWFPLGFTVGYLFLLPWILLGVQVFQEKANGQRKALKLRSDTNYLSQKIDFVRAESALEEVKLEHELRTELERKTRELDLEREQARHDFEIERERKNLEFDLDERKRTEDNKIEHDKQMRQLELEERRRKDEIQLERYKAEKGVGVKA